MKGLKFAASAVLVGLFGLAGCVVDGDTLDDVLNDDENGGESSDDGDGDAGKDSGSGDEGGAGGADTGGDQGGSATASGGAGNEGGAATAGAAPTETGGAATAGAAPTETGGAATAGAAPTETGGAAGAPVVEGGAAGAPVAAAGAPVAAGGAVPTAGAPQGGAEETGTGDIDVGEICTVTEECKPGSLCFEGVCVQTGNIRVSLSWTAVIDLDLHVQTPAGGHIYYSNPIADGGELDVDDCVGLSCLDNEATHVENIFFESAARGEYSVWVRNYNAGGSTEPIPYTITIMVNGAPYWIGEGAVVEYESSEPYTFTY